MRKRSGRSEGESSLTFWSACPSCTRVYECGRSQEMHNLRCSDCMTTFVATEVATISVNHTLTLTTGDKMVVMNKNAHEVKGECDAQKQREKANRHGAKRASKYTKTCEEGSGSGRRKRKKAVSVCETGLDHFREDLSVEIVDPGCIDVEDSDFYDFDQDRVENCFQENQIWAIYDDDDGLPRYYALINNVVSLNPFKVQMSWLENKDNNSKWAHAGLWRSCGEFQVGRKTVTEFLNVFSHVMKGEKVVAGIVKIFPRKGSVWALYRDWQSDWDEYTPEEVRHKYEIVEVITDFKETLGGSVVPLVKLHGFRSVYHKKQIGCQAVKWVKKTEFARFSHQIPARRLLGDETHPLPKGCWELDPAATPIPMD